MYPRHPGNPIELTIPNMAFQTVQTVDAGQAVYVPVSGTQSNVGRQWVFYCASGGAQIFWGSPATTPQEAQQGMPLAANSYLPLTFYASGTVIYNSSASPLSVSVLAMG